jgi:hypothetical protein
LSENTQTNQLQRHWKYKNPATPDQETRIFEITPAMAASATCFSTEQADSGRLYGFTMF